MGKKKISKLQKIMCSFIYKVRQEVGLNQTDFATKLRMNNINASQGYISQIENGYTKVSVIKLERMLAVFNYEIGASLSKKAKNE